ncbi:hypothetical protein [Halostella litorea]|nr:hypothetical protein [Halostella litorea]
MMSENEPDNCDGCGIEITNDVNLTRVEVDGNEEQWCPGCRGAGGGGE